MSIRHLLSISDLTDEELANLVALSAARAEGLPEGNRPMDGMHVGLYFKISSTRTRTSFTIAAAQLGASVIAYGPADLQLITGESIADTARVLANYLDVLIVRTNGPITEMRQLAAQSSMAIINGMSDNEHPTQAIADLSTITEAFGQVEGMRILYLGEGNNTAAALALALAKTPRTQLTVVSPIGDGLSSPLLEHARQLAAARGSSIDQHHDMHRLPERVDVVYTTRWTTMGVPKADSDWLDRYRPFAVTSEVMARVSGPRTIFMHDLPAMRGQEVTDEVLDGPRSVAFRQAYHKLTGAMAVLCWCTGRQPASMNS